MPFLFYNLLQKVLGEKEYNLVLLAYHQLATIHYYIDGCKERQIGSLDNRKTDGERYIDR